jgi:hypothetical protein
MSLCPTPRPWPDRDRLAAPSSRAAGALRAVCTCPGADTPAPASRHRGSRVRSGSSRPSRQARLRRALRGGAAVLGQGRCLQALSLGHEAAPVLEKAREIFERLGAKPALAEAEGLLQQTAHLTCSFCSIKADARARPRPSVSASSCARRKSRSAAVVSVLRQPDSAAAGGAQGLPVRRSMAWYSEVPVGAGGSRSEWWAAKAWVM